MDPKGTSVKVLSADPSRSEKSAVKNNIRPIMSINVSAVRPVSLQGFFFFSSPGLKRSFVVGSHGNREHRGGS